MHGMYVCIYAWMYVRCVCVCMYVCMFVYVCKYQVCMLLSKMSQTVWVMGGKNIL